MAAIRLPMRAGGILAVIEANERMTSVNSDPCANNVASWVAPGTLQPFMRAAI